MRDLIDERNKREKIKSSIIKRWNVNYTDVQPIGGPDADEKEEKGALGSGITPGEDGTDAERSRREYNKTTGSYSGAYGKGEVDDVTKGQIDLILNEKEASLRDLIENGQK